MGVGVIESDGSDLSLSLSTVILPKRRDPLAARLHHLYSELSAIIGEVRPSEVAIEEPFVGENIRSALSIGQAQAVAMVAAAAHGLAVTGYAPSQVKQAVTDHGGSSKDQVGEMVRVLLRLDEVPSPSDASDALAVAICHVNSIAVRDLVITE